MDNISVSFIIIGLPEVKDLKTKYYLEKKMERDAEVNLGPIQDSRKIRPNTRLR